MLINYLLLLYIPAWFGVTYITRSSSVLNQHVPGAVCVISSEHRFLIKNPNPYVVYNAKSAATQ